MIDDGIWLERAQEMYDDGVITYSAPRGNYRRQFRLLEEQLGLNFKRVKRREAEIVCLYREIENEKFGGLAELKPKHIVLTTEPVYRNTKIEAHEIGHALGLDHMERGTNSVMNYDWSRNDFFTPVDLQNISIVYDLQ